MLRGIYKIAGHVFALNTIYETIHQLCKDYQTAETVEYEVVTSEEDIKKRRSSHYKRI